MNPKRLGRILMEVRERGYATRDPVFTGWTYGGPPRHDGLAAIAVPLLGQGRTYGAINILWIKAASTVEEFAARYLEDLQGAARDIVNSLEAPPKARLVR